MKGEPAAIEKGRAGRCRRRRDEAGMAGGVLRDGGRVRGRGVGRWVNDQIEKVQHRGLATRGGSSTSWKRAPPPTAWMSRWSLRVYTRKPVDTCADYHLKGMRPICATTYPIATGVIEGACRHLVRDRMELSGARWRLVGAEAVLKAPGAARQRRLRCVLGLPRSARVRAEPRPAIR